MLHFNAGRHSRGSRVLRYANSQDDCRWFDSTARYQSTIIIKMMKTKHNRPHSGPNCASSGVKTRLNQTFKAKPLARELLAFDPPFRPEESVTMQALEARLAEIENNLPVATAERESAAPSKPRARISAASPCGKAVPLPPPPAK